MNQSIKKYQALALFSLACSTANTAFANNNIENVIVTATRFEQSINTLPANINVISQEDITNSGALTISDLLGSLSEVQISNNSSGEVISLRGFSPAGASNNVLIIVDGRRLNNNDIASPDLSSIAINLIERIEVLNGSAAVLYGDQAVGGVVNIVTKKNNTSTDKKTSVDLRAGLGSYSAREFYVGLEHQLIDSLSVRADIESAKTNNYRDNNEEEKNTYSLRTQYTGDESLFYFELQKIDEDLEIPAGLSQAEVDLNRRQSLPEFQNDFSDTTTEIARIGAKQKISKNWEYGIDLTSRKAEIDFLQSFRGFAVTDKDRAERDQFSFNPRLLGNFDFNERQLLLLLGADYDRADYAIESAFTNRENEQTVKSFYLQATIPVFSIIDLTAGVRNSDVEDDIRDALVYPNGEKLNSDITVSQIGLTIKPNKNLRFYVRAEENFRLAKVDEQAFTSPGVLGLDPQEGLSKELGFEWNNNSSHFSVNVYQLDLEDEIVFDTTAPQPIGSFFAGANVNADESERKGLLISYSYDHDDFNVGVSAQKIDAEFTVGTNSGNDIPYVADETFNTFFNYKGFDNINLRLEGVYISDRFSSSDNANTDSKVDSYQVWDASVSYKQDKWLFALRMNNIFNEEYESASSVSGFFTPQTFVPAAKANYNITASYHFE